MVIGPARSTKSSLKSRQHRTPDANMNILVVGSGGREHAVVDALAQSSKVARIYAAPGNGGIREQAELVPLQVDDLNGILEFAKANAVDLTFVGPESPLSKGIVDVFREHGLAIVGPTADNARLESSKIFAKQFFKANGIPTAAFSECETPAEAHQAIELFKYPIVIKA